jgi:hypothetical protein
MWTILQSLTFLFVTAFILGFFTYKLRDKLNASAIAAKTTPESAESSPQKPTVEPSVPEVTIGSITGA